MPRRADPRDIELDVDELIGNVEDLDSRVSPLEAWKAASDELRRLWGNRAWVFCSGLAGTILAAAIISRVVK